MLAVVKFEPRELLLACFVGERDIIFELLLLVGVLNLELQLFGLKLFQQLEFAKLDLQAVFKVMRSLRTQRKNLPGP